MVTFQRAGEGESPAGEHTEGSFRASTRTE